MPNWCQNRLQVIAKTDTARALLPRLEAGFDEEVEGDAHAFQIILPMPEELKGRDAPEMDEAKAAEFRAKYGAADWYDWRIAYWGTKWCSINLGVEKVRDRKTLQAEFQTAWAPPIGIYARLQAMGFDVLATYAEQGCDFAGYWHNGAEDSVGIDWGDRGQFGEEDDYIVIERTFAKFPNIPTEMYPCGLGG